jgi:hypothetical protein
VQREARCRGSELNVSEGPKLRQKKPRQNLTKSSC